MNGKNSWLRVIIRVISYVLVAALSCALTLAFWGGKGYSKLSELQAILERQFIGETDSVLLQDAAADAMVQALGDRWSFYIPAEELNSYQDNKNNAYVGVGITVQLREDKTGFDIVAVTPGGSAQEAGILAGDILIEVDGQSVEDMIADQVAVLVKGEEGSAVTVTVTRAGERKTFTMERRTIKVVVASGELLPENIGLVRIENFNTNCAKETIAVIESLQQQGAKALIFDVRNNPGGYVHEMLEVLDYLLPEGVLFRTEDYLGRQDTRYSDEKCLGLPMMVLANGDSYSAAEFFAAALREYNWAKVVGEKTVGKGYYQNTLMLSDGSAVNLSTGKYFTPNGVNLTEAGGLTPDLTVAVDEETAMKIYAKALPVAEDPQVQAAVTAILEAKPDKITEKQ